MPPGAEGLIEQQRRRLRAMVSARERGELVPTRVVDLTACAQHWELMAQVSELEKQMFEYAKELEFEKAASLRDEIEQLRKQVVALS